MKTRKTDLVMQNRIFMYLAAATGLILSVPLLANWPWDLTDFIVMGVLLFGAGSIFVLVARVTPRKYRVLIGVGFFVALLLMWVHLAVGIVNTWPLAGN